MSGPADRGGWPRPFIPIADSLLGRPSDQHRHAIARMAFMTILNSDARVISTSKSGDIRPG